MASSVKTQEWGSRLGLILAMAGNAVGLGNFLRFPIQAVQNGGGAFIIPYLVSFVLLGLPLCLIEWSSGKMGGAVGHHSPPFILQQLDKRPIWKYLGSFGIFSSFVIASYYCYIESWTLSYAIHSICGVFSSMTDAETSAFFDNYLTVGSMGVYIRYESVISFLICLSLNIWVLSRGLEKGIEKIAKILMPLLLLFGVFLAIKAYTMKAGVDGAIYDGVVGMNFLWEPQFDSLSNPKVWLAAAGQIFFTLSLGMGCIQSYASYMKRNDDVVMNSMAAGFTNEFTEIVIGSAILIPISIGYLGVDRVFELTQSGGFGLGFRTMPYLFSQWGDVLGAIAGFAFFGLLFFSGITSTLALATPTVGFFFNSFGWSQRKSAVIFGFMVLALAIPNILFFDKGVFDQFDYWGGTVSLFFFAMIEAILFSWVMGVDRGWKMMHRGAELRLPVFFKYVLKYVTPTMLIVIFVSALVKPKDDDWSKISFSGWELDNSSIIAELTHQGVGPNSAWFSDFYYSENEGVVSAVSAESVSVGNKTYSMVEANGKAVVSVGDYVRVGDRIYSGNVVNTVFYVDITRLLLLALLLVICIMIYVVNKKPHFVG